MNITNIAPGERGFSITWNDQSVAEYPYVWLRDNDPADLHPDTHERVFDLTTVSLDIRPTSHEANELGLVVQWPDKETASSYESGWLYRHRPGQKREDPSAVEQVYWDAETMTSIPRADVSACVKDPAALMDALISMKRSGLVIFQGLDDSPDASREFADRVGFPRQTNFGVMFEVVSEPDPINLAYTSLALPLHTDLPNQELIPGYQFLHAWKNTVTGGESIFADGFRICEDLASDAPADFELLSTVPVPFRFHDDNNDIRHSRPIICKRDNGAFDYFVFNAHIADIPDMASDQLYDFYRAYQSLMHRIRNPRYAVRTRLAPGEMAAFDNSRVLHSRTAFDPTSGERHYRGYYLERNEVDSRIRVLSRD